MSIIRVKGFKIYNDRHGKKRCYHRKTGIAINLDKNPIGTASFFAECQKVADAERSTEGKAGTLGMLVKQYKQHPSFTDLAPKTKESYERIFRYLVPAFNMDLRAFTTPIIVKMRDKIADAHGRRTGNYLKTVMSIVFSWGKERGICQGNPATGIKALPRDKNAGYANRPWADNEREAVLAALPDHMRLPVTLMMFCGLDPKDALMMPKSAIKDGIISVSRSKTNEPVWIPLPQPIAKEIERSGKNDTIMLCVNSYGVPWTVSGFRASWRKVKLKLEEENKIGENLTLKGLRHTVGTMLAEMGYDDRTIADMLGQRTTQMAQHYSRSANRTRKLTPVVAAFEDEVARRKAKAKAKP